ncbi:MAG: UDP-N-acetylglucosamine 1-carboxyvinyltransferase [Bacillota bacterium]
MESFVIKGGYRLEGTTDVGGAKNAALPIMAATLLAAGESTIHGVPELRDIEMMGELLSYLGAHISRDAGVLTVEAAGIARVSVPESLMRRMRASNLVLGPLLARFGEVCISQPGGCNIGARPMDLHIRGLRALGAEITERAGFIMARATRLRGAEIHLDVPSVGATENLMMAAVLAEGTTVIRNAAKEPEIVDLQNFLNRLGARVKGAGTGVLRIEGVRTLHPTEHHVIPDRIEAGTHMVAAAITGGDVLVTNVIPEHVEPVIAKLREMGARVEVTDEGVRVRVSGRLKAIDLKTMPYPGFPTDMQPQFMALLTVAEGASIVTETIFENRFKHVPELARMGADIRIEGHTAIVRGVGRLTGAHVEASDLRAGAALILAGLAAENTTVVDRAAHIDRGYARLEEKYRLLGADIVRVRN